MVWERIIEKEKITSVKDEFYNELSQKLKQRIPIWDAERFFCKKHIWMSIAAGILLGLVMLNLQDYISTASEQQAQMEAWISRYYLDDILIEKIDLHLF